MLGINHIILFFDVIPIRTHSWRWRRRDMSYAKLLDVIQRDLLIFRYPQHTGVGTMVGKMRVVDSSSSVGVHRPSSSSSFPDSKEGRWSRLQH